MPDDSLRGCKNEWKVCQINYFVSLQEKILDFNFQDWFKKNSSVEKVTKEEIKPSNGFGNF